MGDIREVADAIRGFESFVITAHVNPEGDAIGSILGLALALKKIGKKVTVISRDPVPEFLHFLPGGGMVRICDSIEEPHDAFIAVDCDPERTGIRDLGLAPVKKIINIDHHITNLKTSDIWWVDPDAAAAGEMVYDLISHMGIPIDIDIATNLYTCIFTDTGSFRYTNTDEAALSKSAKLLSYGVDTWQIAENVYESKSFGRMKLLGLVLSTIGRSEDGRVSWVVVKEEFYGATGTSAEDTDGFINYPRAVKGVEVAVLFREAGDKVKLSLRSKGRVDVSRLAQGFGGGGHPNASGAVMDMGLEQAMSLVLPTVTESAQKVFA